MTLCSEYWMTAMLCSLVFAKKDKSPIISKLCCTNADEGRINKIGLSFMVLCLIMYLLPWQPLANLISSDTGLSIVLQTKTRTHGQAAFISCDPCLWTNLQVGLKAAVFFNFLKCTFLNVCFIETEETDRNGSGFGHFDICDPKLVHHSDCMN